MTDVKIVAAQQAQSKKSKADLLDLLMSKKKRTRTIEVQVNGEKVELVFAALSANELDTLQGQHTPNAEQRSKNMAFNPDTFPAALVAACSVEPKISHEEAKEIWKSEAWSTGELNFLFDTVSALCMEGLNVPFSESV